MSDKELLQQALDALIIAEAGLADIGDADREPGDDLKWCEARAAQALESPRQAIVALAAAIAQPVQPARSAAMNRMHTRIAMVQALSWLENHGAVVFSGGGMTSVDSMNAVAKRLRNALASPQPVQPDDVQRVLTDAEIVRIHNRYGGDMVNCARAIERAVEAVSVVNSHNLRICQHTLHVIGLYWLR